MKLAMYFSPLKMWINNSFKIYFAVQLDNLSFNHSVNLYSFFPYHRWSIFFLFEYYFILNFWAVSYWLKYKEDKRSSYMDIHVRSSVHNGIEEYTKKIMKQNLACLFIFSTIFIRHCGNFLMRQTVGKEVINRRNAPKGVNDI